MGHVKFEGTKVIVCKRHVNVSKIYAKWNSMCTINLMYVYPFVLVKINAIYSK